MAGKPANFNSMSLERTALALVSTASTCSRKSNKVLLLLADLSAMAPHSEPMAPNLSASHVSCIRWYWRFIVLAPTNDRRCSADAGNSQRASVTSRPLALRKQRFTTVMAKTHAVLDPAVHSAFDLWSHVSVDPQPASATGQCER
jgi:hypothetical protein